MKNSFDNLITTSGSAIKYWWLILIFAILVFCMGVFTFAYPAISYLTMSIAFGWIILFSGISQIVLFSTNKHIVTNRGWMLAGGIIEGILGLILITCPVLSAAILPWFLALWLLFRGFSMIGFGSDMMASGIAGGGWTILTAILLMIAAIMIMIHPVLFGVEAVLIWIGISLVFGGISAGVFAFQLRKAHHNFIH